MKFKKLEDRELSLEELELVRGGFDYSGFYRYRAEVLNAHQIKLKSSGDDYLEKTCMSMMPD
tara:strand:+ start:320 stop:505 length:186 start_codon:yes stop_codon:yes gene_type:complete